MTRQPDLERKPALIEQILDYLLDKPLSSLSFRTLAKALEVSTFTLVYHFGTRAELVSDIVSAISMRAEDVEDELMQSPTTIDSYLLGQIKSWEWSVQPRNIRLQCLEFEAALLEAHDREAHEFTRTLYTRWYEMGCEALVDLGLSQEEATVEARLAVDTFFGLQYDLVVNEDVERATAAFHRSIEVRRERLERLLAHA
ncbi:TetR family transcriptional regulator [Homoserinimonas aerilata]|uniref:TetR family transcriptional regulator n=1 Tax=Homoserinimonas aerilata TaxID=1162970 RepID=A0A542YGP4_9MICO|nr:TetR/AcrR family transcriptional regulator [Homoserinimonas aerilata]TQL47260.1 TetR family transcriptional regulator [Homoserinimonas aerilata]